MLFSKLLVNMKGTIDDIAYKSKLIARDVSVNSRVHFKIYSANPAKLDFGKEIMLLSLLSNVKKGEVIYDIGANIGLYALALSKYQPDNLVYAFEPTPETFDKLKSNLALNRTSDNVKPFQIAIGNTNGQSDFIVSSQHERSSFYQSGATFGNAQVKSVVKVDVRTLDSFIGQMPAPQHIKIDAEGSEAIILEGAAETIRKYKPLLYIEPHSFDLEDKITMILQLLDYEFENYSGHYICNPVGHPKAVVTTEILALA